METILALFFRHPLAGRPLGTIVIPSETDISTLQVEKYIEAYKSEDPLIRAQSSLVKSGILSPSSLETDSGK
jgi:hypothetical protein